MTTMMFASAAQVTFPVLPALLILPAAGAVLVSVLPRRRTEMIKQVAVLVSVATAGITFWLITAFGVISF